MKAERQPETQGEIFRLSRENAKVGTFDVSESVEVSGHARPVINIAEVGAKHPVGVFDRPVFMSLSTDHHLHIKEVTAEGIVVENQGKSGEHLPHSHTDDTLITWSEIEAKNITLKETL